MEAATLSTVLLVSLYRTPAALEAAWKYFILCGVGIAQALFGTILLYFAAEQVLGAGGNALFWTELLTVKAHLEPHILITAFVFLLVGYGTKAGLVPLHNWLPDAHAEGPTPISAVLSGLLLNVAVYAIVRNKAIIDSPLANHLLMGFGLVTVLVAVCFLFRQKDIKRLFAYSSIEHMGLITFAFGLGTPLACVAGVIHMTMHSLTKSAIFFAAGHASQKAGSQLISQIRGLLSINPILGWGLLLGSLAIVGLPPFGLFTSEWLILLSTLQQAPYALPLLLLALLLAFAAILYKVQNMTLGESNLPKLTHRPAAFPIYSHLIIVLAFGISLPAVFMTWYQQMSSWMVY
jgi:hydrogenase-4 component F